MVSQQLLDKIKTAHEANRGCYVSPRIYHEMKDEIPCSVNRVARLMRQHGCFCISHPKGIFQRISVE
ncbi:MAG: transposase [Chloroflexi bacterium]|nr:transposase [Chloroflexota bacterium]